MFSYKLHVVFIVFKERIEYNPVNKRLISYLKIYFYMYINIQLILLLFFFETHVGNIGPKYYMDEKAVFNFYEFFIIRINKLIFLVEH